MRFILRYLYVWYIFAYKDLWIEHNIFIANINKGVLRKLNPT